MATKNKLTDAQKEQREINRLCAAKIRQREQEEYELQQKEHLAMYKASIPKRLMEAQALAVKLYVSVHVSLVASGVAVRFEFENHHKKIYIDDTITYETEEWELDVLEKQLADMNAERIAAEARLIVAQGIWNRLSAEERAAIKEHQFSLR